MDAVRASCSIPFVLDAVHDIAGAPRGAYCMDYHMHLDYLASQTGQGVVLYPHFQKAVVPGWLDKTGAPPPAQCVSGFHDRAGS